MGKLPNSAGYLKKTGAFCHVYYLFSKYLVIEFQRYHVTGSMWYF